MPAQQHVDGVLLEPAEADLEAPPDIAQGDQVAVLVAQAAVEAVDHEVEGQVREGRGVEDERWLGSHGTSGRNSGCPAIGRLVGGGIASLRGPVGGACDRIESSSGSCQTGRNLGFHHPLRSPVSNSLPMPTATTTASAGVDSQLEVVERKVPLELERVDYTVR